MTNRGVSQPSKKTAKINSNKRNGKEELGREPMFSTYLWYIAPPSRQRENDGICFLIIRKFPLNLKVPLFVLNASLRSERKGSKKCFINFDYVFSGVHASPYEGQSIGRLLQGMSVHPFIVTHNES